MRNEYLPADIYVLGAPGHSLRVLCRENRLKMVDYREQSRAQSQNRARDQRASNLNPESLFEQDMLGLAKEGAWKSGWSGSTFNIKARPYEKLATSDYHLACLPRDNLRCRVRTAKHMTS